MCVGSHIYCHLNVDVYALAECIFRFVCIYSPGSHDARNIWPTHTCMHAYMHARILGMNACIHAYKRSYIHTQIVSETTGPHIHTCIHTNVHTYIHSSCGSRFSGSE